jgi:hypothetical protein
MQGNHCEFLFFERQTPSRQEEALGIKEKNFSGRGGDGEIFQLPKGDHFIFAKWGRLRFLLSHFLERIIPSEIFFHQKCLRNFFTSFMWVVFLDIGKKIKLISGHRTGVFCFKSIPHLGRHALSRLSVTVAFWGTHEKFLQNHTLTTTAASFQPVDSHRKVGNQWSDGKPPVQNQGAFPHYWSQRRWEKSHRPRNWRGAGFAYLGDQRFLLGGALRKKRTLDVVFDLRVAQWTLRGRNSCAG